MIKPRILAILWLIRKLGIFKTTELIALSLLGIRTDRKICFLYNKKKVYLNIESTRVDLASLTEIFYFKSYEIKHKISPKFILDAGANKGLASVYFNLTYPNAKIVCFEPNKVIINILKENLKINNVRAIVYESALSNRDGFMYFVEDPQHLYSMLSKDKTSTKVKTVKLQNLFKNKHIDILKLDIEGSEEDVISSLDDPNIDFIVGEMHYDRINAKKVFNKLKELGYRLDQPYPQYKLLNNEEELPLIIAKKILV